MAYLTYNSINRRLTFHQKYKCSWTIEIIDAINREILIKGFQTVRDHIQAYDVTYSAKRDRRGNGTHYTLTLTRLGTLKFHLHKLSGFEKEQIDNLLKKTLKPK